MIRLEKGIGVGKLDELFGGTLPHFDCEEADPITGEVRLWDKAEDDEEIVTVLYVMHGNDMDDHDDLMFVVGFESGLPIAGRYSYGSIDEAWTTYLEEKAK